MSKHTVLTENEFLDYSPNKQALVQIESYRINNGLTKNEMKILDWGCGRGREVLWLRNMGYCAYGVDIDMDTILNGEVLFKSRGSQDASLKLISQNSEIDFPDNYFHFVCSNQVFEHVKDIRAVIAEISRVTKGGGSGYHVYPAQKTIFEKHLNMLFVHWFPKNLVRKVLIYIFVMLGKEPCWKELDKVNNKEKANAYYQYSIKKTFYRKHSFMESHFRANGFIIIESVFLGPRVIENKIFIRLMRYKMMRKFVSYLVITFIRVDLHVRKN